jgi:hypothetical protein
MKIDKTNLLEKYQEFRKEYDKNFAKYASASDAATLIKMNGIVNRDYESMNDGDVFSNICSRYIRHGVDKKIALVQTGDPHHTKASFTANVYDVKINIIVDVFPTSMTHVYASLYTCDTFGVPTCSVTVLERMIGVNFADLVGSKVNDLKLRPLESERVTDTITGFVGAVREYRKTQELDPVPVKMEVLNAYLKLLGVKAEYKDDDAIELGEKVSAFCGVLKFKYNDYCRYSVREVIRPDKDTIAIITSDCVGDTCITESYKDPLNRPEPYTVFKMTVKRLSPCASEHSIYYLGDDWDKNTTEALLNSINVERAMNGNVLVDPNFIRWSHDLMIEMLRCPANVGGRND